MKKTTHRQIGEHTSADGMIAGDRDGGQGGRRQVRCHRRNAALLRADRDAPAGHANGGRDPRLHGRGSEMGGTDALYAQGRTAAGGDVRLYREGRDLSGFCAADRVVGRAAAMLFVKAGVHAVFAEVMSDGAAALLAAHGIDASCDVRAPQRSRTGKRPAPARWRVPWPGSRTSTRASRRSAAVRRSCARGIDSRPVLCYAPKKAFWEARQWN